MSESSTPVELARGWIEAWSRFDMPWLRAHLADDFVHVSPFGRLSGRDRYLATVEPIARDNAHELTVHDVFADGGRAVIWFDNHTPSGIVPTCDWVSVSGGRIAAVHSFYDSTLVREVLSAAELRELGGAGR